MTVGVTILFILVIALILTVVYLHEELLMTKTRLEKLESKDIDRVTSRILDTLRTDDELHG